MHSQPIDRQTGIWEHPARGTPQAELFICSDWAPIRDYSQIILETPEKVYGDLLGMLRSSDLRIVNLECPLCSEDTPVFKSGSVLKGLPEHIKGLTVPSFDVATMANNHVFDYGTDAFVQTRRLLEQNGIRSLGAGMNVEEAARPLIETVNGIRIGIVNFSEGEDLTAAGDGPGVLGWEVDRVVDIVKGLRGRVAATIVICHGGLEYIPCPPPYIAEAFHRIADAGADLVIGHHPHVPQGVTIRNHVPICFSLGNFVFFQHTDLLYRKIGYMVQAGVSDTGLSRIRIIPYQILQDRLALLTGAAFSRFMTTLDTISAPLLTEKGILDAWNGFHKYYAHTGFKKEIANIMEQFSSQPEKGAAMFRNRLTTRQHYHQLVDFTTRIVSGKLDSAPEWAVSLAADWFTQTVDGQRPSDMLDNETDK